MAKMLMLNNLEMVKSTQTSKGEDCQSVAAPKDKVCGEDCDGSARRLFLIVWNEGDTGRRELTGPASG
jgi:hypothetical protein